MSLRKKITTTAAASLSDTVITRIILLISTALVFRSLDSDAVAFIGITAGYQALITFLNITPESVLIRDFPKLKENLNQHVSAFIHFWFYRSLIMFGATLLIAFLLWETHHRIDLSIFFILNGLAFFFGLLQGIFKEIFFADFKQGKIFLVNTVAGIMQVALILYFYDKMNIILYGGIIFGLAACWSVGWWLLAKKKYHFVLDLKVNWKKISIEGIKDFSLWTHLTSSTNRVVYQFDLVILSFLATLTDVSAYTIAITAGNMLLVLPTVLQRTVILALSNIKDGNRIGEVTGLFLKYYIMLSIGEFIFFWILGKPLLALFTTGTTDLAYALGLPIIAGMIFLNSVRPLGALIQSHLSLRQAFFSITLPTMIFSVVAYTIGGWWFGPIGVAYANIPAYLLSAVLTIISVKPYWSKIKLKLITQDEINYVMAASKRISSFFAR